MGDVTACRLDTQGGLGARASSRWGREPSRFIKGKILVQTKLEGWHLEARLQQH